MVCLPSAHGAKPPLDHCALRKRAAPKAGLRGIVPTRQANLLTLYLF
jgi:hypothetical protein